MTHQPKIIVVTDPRTFDGTPYVVADRAVGQIVGLLDHALGILPETRKMVLNSDLERQLALGDDELDPAASILARKVLEVEKELAALRKRLQIIQQATVFDPKHPPRA